MDTIFDEIKLTTSCSYDGVYVNVKSAKVFVFMSLFIGLTLGYLLGIYFG